MPAPMTAEALSNELASWEAFTPEQRVEVLSVVRSVQLHERAVGVTRDVAQTANNRDMCDRHRELVDIVRANNARAQ